MDTSSQHQQEQVLHEAALRHAIHGVSADELSAEGRAIYLRHAIATYVEAWVPELPPGFNPYGRRVAAATVDFGRVADKSTQMMVLARLPARDERDQTLVLTSPGKTLLLEQSTGDRTSEIRFWVTALTDGELRDLHADPEVLRKSLVSLTEAQKRGWKRTDAANIHITGYFERIF